MLDSDQEYPYSDVIQVIKNHLPVSPEDYADPEGKIRIPQPSDLPNVDLEVMNYHQPIFGTFHAKYRLPAKVRDLTNADLSVMYQVLCDRPQDCHNSEQQHSGHRQSRDDDPV